MKTFDWKFWRFAWLTHANWGWSTTVIDSTGRWRKVFGHLCFLVEHKPEWNALSVHKTGEEE